MKKILVLCTGNSCRSQMAEGFLKKYILEKKINAEVYSAGVEAHGLNPRAVAVMKEAEIDISSHTSKNIDELLSSPLLRGVAFDYVITVCDNAKESCPVFPKAKHKLHRNFPDPAKASGTEEEIMNQFRKVRDEINFFCKNFIRQNLQ